MSNWSDEGVQAFKNGVALKDNPYADDVFSESFCDWELGWTMAKELADKADLNRSKKDRSPKTYTERPPKGTVARLAWDLYVHEQKCLPEYVEYSPNYDHQRKGWICEDHIPDPAIKHMGYGGSNCHVFYSSDFLKSKKEFIEGIEYCEPKARQVTAGTTPTEEEIQQFNELTGKLTERVRQLYQQGIKLFDARTQALSDQGFASIDEYLVANGCNVIANSSPNSGTRYTYRNTANN